MGFAKAGPAHLVGADRDRGRLVDLDDRAACGRKRRGGRRGARRQPRTWAVTLTLLARSPPTEYGPSAPLDRAARSGPPSTATVRRACRRSRTPRRSPARGRRPPARGRRPASTSPGVASSGQGRSREGSEEGREHRAWRSEGTIARDRVYIQLTWRVVVADGQRYRSRREDHPRGRRRASHRRSHPAVPRARGLRGRQRRATATRRSRPRRATTRTS